MLTNLFSAILAFAASEVDTANPQAMRAAPDSKVQEIDEIITPLQMLRCCEGDVCTSMPWDACTAWQDERIMRSRAIRARAATFVSIADPQHGADAQRMHFCGDTSATKDRSGAFPVYISKCIATSTGADCLAHEVIGCNPLMIGEGFEVHWRPFRPSNTANSLHPSEFQTVWIELAGDEVRSAGLPSEHDTCLR